MNIGQEKIPSVVTKRIKYLPYNMTLQTLGNMVSLCNFNYSFATLLVVNTISYRASISAFSHACVCTVHNI